MLSEGLRPGFPARGRGDCGGGLSRQDGNAGGQKSLGAVFEAKTLARGTTMCRNIQFHESVKAEQMGPVWQLRTCQMYTNDEHRSVSDATKIKSQE